MKIPDELSKGRGRTRVSLQVHSLGGDLVVFIYNRNAHIGAVAVGEWDREHNRASVSLVTRLGHKDDAVAQRAAYMLSKALQKPVCAVAGIHLDDITLPEIKKLVQNAADLVTSYLKTMINI